MTLLHDTLMSRVRVRARAVLALHVAVLASDEPAVCCVNKRRQNVQPDARDFVGVSR